MSGRRARRDVVGWMNLQAAVITACRIRGDSREHRDACLADLRKVPPAEWTWWQGYFEAQRPEAAGRAAA